MDFGDSEIFRGFSDSEGEGEVEEENVGPLIHHAASVGDIRQLVQVVQQDPTMLEQHNSEGLTPLGQAVLSQQMPAVKRLVKMGADINALDGIGRTCVSIAAYQGWLEGVVFLLRNGARQNICDKAGRLPIHAATYDKDVRTLATLLQSLSLPEINQPDHESMTALHWAAFHNRPEHMRCLIEKGGNILAQDVDGKLPLHWAAQNDCSDCCRLLLEKEEIVGKEVDDSMLRAQDHTGKTPLHFAAAAGHAGVLSLLAAHPLCQCDAVDPDDRTSLHWATAMGHTECVKVLLGLGVKVNVEDADGGTPLTYATQSGNVECMKLLEQALTTPRVKRDGKKPHTSNSKKAKNPLGFFKGLFQSGRKDPEMMPHHDPEAPSAENKNRGKPMKASGESSMQPRKKNSDQNAAKSSNDNFSLPPISRSESERDRRTAEDGGSPSSSYLSRVRNPSKSNNRNSTTEESEKEKSRLSKETESKGSKGFPAIATSTSVLPPLYPGAQDRESNGVTELGPLRGVQVKLPRQLSGRAADRVQDGMLFQKSATEFWTPPSHQPAEDDQLTQTNYHPGLRGGSKRRSRSNKKARRKAGDNDPLLSVRSEHDSSSTNYTTVHNTTTPASGFIPSSSFSSRRLTELDPSSSLFFSGLAVHQEEGGCKGTNGNNTANNNVHPSRGHPSASSTSTSTTHHQRHPHSQVHNAPQRSRPLHRGMSSGSFRLATPLSNVSGNVPVHDGEDQEGLTPQEALFVSASSMAMHTRTSSFGSRDKLQVSNRNKLGDIRMVDV